MSEGIIIRQRGTIREVMYRDAYAWRCECGWMGSGLPSPEACVQEAGRHWDEFHKGAPRPMVELVDD